MRIQIAAVGKLKEKYLVEGVAEYAKRLGPYVKLNMVEVADEKAPESMSEADERLAKRREGERLLALLEPDAYVIALVINGEMWSSERLARELNELGIHGRSRIAFVIGGTLGLSDEVLARADVKLSFGKLTFPHQLMRLILLEQIYRAFKIMRGEPYHK